MKHQKAASRAKPVTEPIVLSTKRVRLTRPQWLMLLELNEPNDNADKSWYFARKDERTLGVLARHGLAEKTDVNTWRVGYRLTKRGKDYVRALTRAGVQP
jgi:hypothetical protein